MFLVLTHSADQYAKVIFVFFSALTVDDTLFLGEQASVGRSRNMYHWVLAWTASSQSP